MGEESVRTGKLLGSEKMIQDGIRLQKEGKKNLAMANVIKTAKNFEEVKIAKLASEGVLPGYNWAGSGSRELSIMPTTLLDMAAREHDRRYGPDTIAIDALPGMTDKGSVLIADMAFLKDLDDIQKQLDSGQYTGPAAELDRKMLPVVKRYFDNKVNEDLRYALSQSLQRKPTAAEIARYRGDIASWREVVNHPLISGRVGLDYKPTATLAQVEAQIRAASLTGGSTANVPSNVNVPDLRNYTKPQPAPPAPSAPSIRLP
ncbi:MAG: hypothetical protein HY360_19405 [Verrucomicrobia bacterium]|nr:hypothetical protein [Verrucomicrobiota bacterium]